MTPIFTQHEGSQAEKPAEVDTTSSSTVVYVRKNIEQFTREEDGETVTLWRYDEAQMTREEYAIYKGEDNAAKIEYVAMMADIDLDETEV